MLLGPSRQSWSAALVPGRRPSIRELATWLDASRTKATTRLAPRGGTMR